MNDLSTPDALTQLADMAAAPFEQAKALPPSVYTSQDMLARELESVFRHDWMCVGRADMLASPGDYVTYELAGQPIFVIRDRDGTLRAQSNVCLHRMSTLLKGQGNTKAITCPYHAWTYSLDGKLMGAPAMGLNEGFCKDQYRLPQIRCEEWLGWIMVSLNPDAPAVADQLSEVQELIAPYGMEHYQQSFYETHIWDTNWKVLAENFMESYHLPVCHAKTVGGLSKLEDMDCPPGLPHFNYHWIIKDASLKIGNAHPDNTTLEGDWRKTTALLAIYPSLLITLTPGYFWYLSLHPRGVGQVHITFGGGLSPDFANDPEGPAYFDQLKTLLDRVNAEDRECTESVYRGLCSDFARAGHLSHLERPNYDFARYLVERMVGPLD